MQSKACHAFSEVRNGTALHILSNLIFDFFVWTVLIQGPAHINSFIFPAMASSRFLMARARTLACV
jgi:hypothetical protein